MPQTPTVATWGGVQIQLVSEDVVNAIDSVKSLLEIVNEALDIALQIGEIAKTFVTSNLDPTRALINELTSLLKNFINDMFGLGIYYNLGDIDILKRGKIGLKGGYPSYERRMLTRLNDKDDPNRPDYTPSATVLAMFFYVGVDVSFTNDLLDTSKFDPLVKFIKAIGALFGMNVSGPNADLPMAVNLRPEYATPDNTRPTDPAMAWALMRGNDRVKVIWNTAPVPGASTQDPMPQIPPTAFIVEVSCYPTGFQVGWISPATSGTGTGSDGSNQAYTTGQYQEGNTGRPLTIFGGEDAIKLNPNVSWPAMVTTTEGTSLPSGAHPAFFFKDPSAPEVIKKAFGKEGTTYYNQRRFFVPKESNIVQMVSGGNYSLTLDLDKIPWYCPIVNGAIDTSRKERPTTVYVRVIPVSARVTESNYLQARWEPKPHTTDELTSVHLVEGVQAGSGGTLGDTDIGVPSEVLEVAIPGGPDTDLYGQAMYTAVAITALSRSDISAPNPVTTGTATVPDPDYTPTGLESIANEVFRGMGINNPENYFARQGISPQAFLLDFHGKVRAQANHYVATRRTPPEVVAQLRDTMTALVNWKWSDASASGAQGNSALRYTIWQSLNPNGYSTSPVALNRRCTRNYYNRETPNEVLAPLLFQWNQGTFGTTGGAANTMNSSPVIGPSDAAQPGYWYARNLIPASIYAKAAQVLAITADENTTRRTPQGAWRSKRLFTPRAPTGAALGLLNMVDGFLGTLLAGTQTGADGIVRVIDFLEQRVQEIQELIKRIETYLEIPFEVSFPSVQGLVLITNGTSGVVSGLLGAQQKPIEGRDGYAGGCVIVAGSAPSILIELLAAGLQSSTGGA